MNIFTLLHGFAYQSNAETEYAEIFDLCADSRLARAGDCFFCLCGANTDGHLFAKQAYQKGVRCFVTERPLSLPGKALCLLVKDSRLLYAHVCRRFHYGDTPYPFRLIGITGTKGKTTVATLLYHVFAKNGNSVALIGTNGIQRNKDDFFCESDNTTPEPYLLHRTLADCAKRGVDTVLLEVSSQAYRMHRVAGLSFEIGVLTNLFLDHIGPGEHPSFADYKACKLELFFHAKHAILPANSPYFSEFASVSQQITTYGETEADYTASDIEQHFTKKGFSLSFFCSAKGENMPLQLCLPGKHNVENALCVVAVAQFCHVEKSAIQAGLRQSVPGRYEHLTLPNGSFVLLDYAHNALSLFATCHTVRPHVTGRLFCLFGSVGGRTQIRRRSMGEAAGKVCDFCILTADNPNWEDPFSICQEIAQGFAPNFPYCILCDREQAICYALEQLRPGDCLLLCGKGTERTQKIRGQAIPFSEKEIILRTQQTLFCKKSDKKEKKGCKKCKKKVQ